MDDVIGVCTANKANRRNASFIVFCGGAVVARMMYIAQRKDDFTVYQYHNMAVL